MTQSESGDGLKECFELYLTSNKAQKSINKQVGKILQRELITFTQQAQNEEIER